MRVENEFTDSFKSSEADVAAASALLLVNRVLQCFGRLKRHLLRRRYLDRRTSRRIASLAFGRVLHLKLAEARDRRFVAGCCSGGDLCKHRFNDRLALGFSQFVFAGNFVGNFICSRHVWFSSVRFTTLVRPSALVISELLESWPCSVLFHRNCPNAGQTLPSLTMHSCIA